MSSLGKTSLIAPCGMNCGVCMAFLRDKNKCPGCRGMSTHNSHYIRQCRIRNCEVFENIKVKFCFSCESFPCKRLKQLDKRYRSKYHMSMLENLMNIKEKGIRQFIKDEEKRWSCSRCGGTICVHRGFCITCGKKKNFMINY